MNRPTTLVRSSVLKETGQVSSQVWDAVPHSSIYLSSHWLKARSQTIRAPARFILLTENEQTVAVAPCYLCGHSAHPGYYPPTMLTSLLPVPPNADVAIGDVDSRSLEWDKLKDDSREWAPAFVVAAPGRYGGASFRSDVSDALMKEDRSSLVQAVERQAAIDGAASIAWSYLVDNEDPSLQAELIRSGYLPCILGAECYLTIEWASFDEYLSSFRSEYRRRIKLESDACDSAGVIIDLFGSDALGPDLAKLEQQWRKKYNRNSDLTGILAEYADLKREMSHATRVFVASVKGRAVGFSVFLDGGDSWYARFIGIDYSIGDIYLYFNLLFYKPIGEMIKRRVAQCFYSMESYDAKRNRGCHMRNMLAFLKPPSTERDMIKVFEANDAKQKAIIDGVAARRVMRA